MDIIKTMTNAELVDHYREMEHLPMPEKPDQDKNYLFFNRMVTEMARRFVDMVEQEQEEAADGL